MKAKIKDTNEIVDVKWNDEVAAATCATDIWYCESKSKNYKECELMFLNKNIDWEQRRYEIARDMLKSIIDGDKINQIGIMSLAFEHKLKICQTAIQYSDIFIDQLKEE